MTFPEAMFYVLLLKAWIAYLFDTACAWRAVCNPRTSSQHQVGSETHLISTEASAQTLRPALAPSAGLCALNENASPETNTFQVWHNSHTRQQRTAQHITCCSGEESGSFWPSNIKYNTACRAPNVRVFVRFSTCSWTGYSLKKISISERLIELWRVSLYVYVQVIFLTLKREALVWEVLVVDVGHEWECCSDWCCRRTPHGGSKRSINAINSSEFTRIFLVDVCSAFMFSFFSSRW